MASVMPAPLRQRVDELAASFTSDVLAAICAVPVSDLWAAASPGDPPTSAPAGGRQPRAAARLLPQDGPARRGRAARLPRRSTGDIGHVVDKIVDLLRQSPGGLRAEQIRLALGLQAKELPRPLKDALRERRITKSGQKRATTYSLRASPGPKRAASRPAARKTAAAKTARSKPGKRASARKTRPGPAPKRAATRRTATKAAARSGGSTGARAEAPREDSRDETRSETKPTAPAS
jgi:hypothetical protein